MYDAARGGKGILMYNSLKAGLKTKIKNFIGYSERGRDAVQKFYTGDIQLHPLQIEAVAAAIASRAKCNLLIFGAGNDSAMWHALNADGYTVFLDSVVTRF
jgi:hypothetical protein